MGSLPLFDSDGRSSLCLQRVADDLRGLDVAAECGCRAGYLQFYWIGKLPPAIPRWSIWFERTEYRLVHLDGGPANRGWKYSDSSVFAGKQASAVDRPRRVLYSICLVTGGSCHLLEMVA